MNRSVIKIQSITPAMRQKIIEHFMNYHLATGARLEDILFLELLPSRDWWEYHHAFWDITRIVFNSEADKFEFLLTFG